MVAAWLSWQLRCLCDRMIPRLRRSFNSRRLSRSHESFSRGGGLAQLAATLSVLPYGPEFEPPPHLPHARYVPLLPLVIKQETLFLCLIFFFSDSLTKSKLTKTENSTQTHTILMSQLLSHDLQHSRRRGRLRCPGKVGPLL